MPSQQAQAVVWWSCQTHTRNFKGNEELNDDWSAYSLYRSISQYFYWQCTGYWLTPIKRDQNFHEADSGDIEMLFPTLVPVIQQNGHLNSRISSQFCENMAGRVAIQ